MIPESQDEHLSLRPWLIPVLIFTAALALRLVNGALLIAHDPLVGFNAPALDMHDHRQWALAIAAGDWLSRGQGVYHYNVLYPHTLAPLYALLGDRVWVEVAWNALLSALACSLTAATAQRIAGAAAGACAGMLLAAYAPSMYLDAHALPESLVTAMAALALWMTVRTVERPERLWPWIGWGVAGALLALARGNGLVLMALVLGGLGFHQWRHRREAPRIWLGPVVALASLVLMLTPTLLRNGLMGGRWVLITSNAPVIWVLGNGADATGTFRFTQTFLDLTEGREYGDISMGEAASAVVRTWAEDPAAGLALMGRKVPLLLSDPEWPDNLSFVLGRQRSPLLRWNPMTFGLLLALALGGLVTRPSQTGAVWPLWLWTGASAFTVWLFIIVGKFRLLMCPALCVLAAVGFVGLSHGSGRGRVRWAATVALVWALSLWAMVPLARGLCFGRMATLASSGWPMAERSIDHGNVGLALLERERTSEALTHISAALQRWPDDHRLRRLHAWASFESGDPAGAIVDLEWLTTREPDNPRHLFNLGLAHWRLGHWAEAEEALTLSLAHDPPPDLGVEAVLQALQERRSPPETVPKSSRRRPSPSSG